jgi:hypothetical protein
MARFTRRSALIAEIHARTSQTFRHDRIRSIFVAVKLLSGFVLLWLFAQDRPLIVRVFGVAVVSIVVVVGAYWDARLPAPPPDQASDVQ